MTSGPLHLQVADFADADHWRWVLTNADGAFLADHPVALDRGDKEYRGFVALPEYLAHYSDPDPQKRPDDERRLVAEVGAWIGEKVFGPLGERILEDTPTVVRVSVPGNAAVLLTYPFELAHVDGRPLALQDVSLALEIAGEAPRANARPVGNRLRLLALFSLPPTTSPLNLRRERQMLRQLVTELTGAAGLAVELKVLQYGVTRDSLRTVLQEGAGWDVVHFSGHGAAGSLFLEDATGGFDLVSSADLAGLLRLTRKQLKLVTLSACHSAAATVEQTLAWLGIDAPPRRDQGGTRKSAETEAPPVVARALVAALDAGVVAMRYAVEDEFAVDLAHQLYTHLFRNEQPLPRAAQLALSAATDDGEAASVGALSVATPALFGARAADLTLTPPLQTDTSFKAPATGLFGFPKEPPRFVGRVAAMTRASAALARQSGQAGVLFHGMAGAGKTACAVELAHHHAAAGRFRAFVWYQAPEEGKDIALARRDFALALEKQLPDVALVHLVDRPEELRAWLPRFRQTLRDTAALIVLDNLETLLTPAGAWRDPFWGEVMAALLGHGGLTRTVLTSRVPPAGLPAPVAVVPVHALARDEALLLARELPGLGALIRGAAAGIGVAEGRDLARRALRVVQGHPKLIELAEGRAADPAVLRDQVERAEAAWAGGALDAFFTDGESRGDAEDFFRQLEGWTNGIAATLPEAARTLFYFLCALEEDDREGWIVEAKWADLWRRLGRPEPAPDPAEGLAALTAAGLAEVAALTTADDEEEDGDYRIHLHPGVADAGRTAAGEGFQAAADAELGAFWYSVFRQAAKAESEGQPAGPLVVRAGLAGAPYLMRQAEWAAASALLEQVFHRDQSPATLGAVLPRMARIAAATAGSDLEFAVRGVLAGMLAAAGRRDEAEVALRDIVDRAEAARQFRTASGAAAHLINLLLASDQAQAALAVAERKPDLSRRAGLGPWTQVLDEGRHLQLLLALGRAQEALDGVVALRDRMRALPDDTGTEEAVHPWHVREVVLDVGRTAALALERWADALALNAEQVQSKAARGATALELARSRFNDYGPLLRLGRPAEARTLLRDCRAAFEAANEVEMLGKVLSALADLEAETTGPAAARGFAETALRYSYLAGDVEGIAISHNNLANYIGRADGASRQIFAHRLAAVLNNVLTKSGNLPRHASNLLSDFQEFQESSTRSLPTSFAALCATVEQVEGVRFAELFARLAGPDTDPDALLQEVIAQAFQALENPE